MIQAALAVGAGVFGYSIGASAAKAPLQAIRESIAALRLQRTAPPPLAGYLEFRGVMHAHTHLSHDSTGTMTEILAAARAAKLDFLALTDHYSPQIFSEGFESRQDSILVLRGMEVALGCMRWSGLTRRCASVLAIGLKEPLAPGANEQWDWDELFKAIRAQGAVSVIAHPRGMMNAGYFPYADGIEIYDIADTVRERVVDIPRHAMNMALEGGDYHDEIVAQALAERSNWNLVEWDRFTRTRRCLGVAGNDAHQNLKIFGRQVDPYPLAFRALNMYVLVPAEAPQGIKAFQGITREKLLTALRAGHAFAAFNLLADAAGFQFAGYPSGGGPPVAIMGDDAAAEDVLHLVVKSPAPALLELLRDGVPVRRQEGRELRYRIDRPGVYRVEASVKIADRWLPWVYTNPIYIKG